MRIRINSVRADFVEALAKAGAGDFAFIGQQKGMFSFSGLTPDHVQQLRDKYSIYLVKSGRINVAGINDRNIERLCSAIADCLNG